MGQKKVPQAGDAPEIAQSLSNLLLQKTSKPDAIDTELDSIFKTSAKPSAVPLLPQLPATRPAPTSIDPVPSTETVKPSKRKVIEEAIDVIVTPKKRRKSNDTPAPRKVLAKTSSSKKDARSASGAEEQSDDDDGDIEGAYFARSQRKELAQTNIASTSKKSATPKTKSVSSEPIPLSTILPETDGEEDDSVPPQHESLATSSKRERERVPKTKSKFVPADETKEQRDARTVFIGNLPVDIVKNKAITKALNRLVTANVPGSKIESTRFRSIAFQSPTNELPGSDDEGESGKKTKKRSERGPPAEDIDDVDSRAFRQHARTSTWRDEHVGSSSNPTNAKVFQSPAEKRRVAFIKGEVHSEASTVHAYIVFAHPSPDRAPNVPAILDPYEAAQEAVQKCDGAVFMERTLRFDLVGSAAATGSRLAGQLDNRRSIFVGGLDFQTKEEDLRKLFEKLVAAERSVEEKEEISESDEAGSDEDEGENKTSMKKEKSSTTTPSQWVTHVRIIRDKDTQLGKGIAYVEFKDRESVDEIMALEPEKFKIAKRKIRVERCKAQTARTIKSAIDSRPGNKDSRQGTRTSHPTPGTGASSSRPSFEASKPRPPRPAPTPIVVPKGDPLLGDRLRGLDKDARRMAKSNDPTRVARRLAKKKAAAAVNADRSSSKSKGGVLGTTKRMGKPKIAAKTSRVRSEKSAAKRNAKK